MAKPEPSDDSGCDMAPYSSRPHDKYSSKPRDWEWDSYTWKKTKSASSMEAASDAVEESQDWWGKAAPYDFKGEDTKTKSAPSMEAAADAVDKSQEWWGKAAPQDSKRHKGEDSSSDTRPRGLFFCSSALPGPSVTDGAQSPGDARPKGVWGKNGTSDNDESSHADSSWAIPEAADSAMSADPTWVDAGTKSVHDTMVKERAAKKKGARNKNNRMQLTGAQGNKKREFNMQTMHVAKLYEVALNHAKKVGANPPPPPTEFPEMSEIGVVGADEWIKLRNILANGNATVSVGETDTQPLVVADAGKHGHEGEFIGASKAGMWLEVGDKVCTQCRVSAMSFRSSPIIRQPRMTKGNGSLKSSHTTMRTWPRSRAN